MEDKDKQLETESEKGAAKAAPEKKAEKPKGNPNLNKKIEVNKPKKEEEIEDNSKITTDSQAMKAFKKSYKLPDGDDFAYVCEDGNVFYKANEGSAMAHAKQKNLKLFIVKP